MLLGYCHPRSRKGPVCGGHRAPLRLAGSMYCTVRYHKGLYCFGFVPYGTVQVPYEKNRTNLHRNPLHVCTSTTHLRTVRIYDEVARCNPYKTATTYLLAFRQVDNPLYAPVLYRMRNHGKQKGRVPFKKEPKRSQKGRVPKKGP